MRFGAGVYSTEGEDIRPENVGHAVLQVLWSQPRSFRDPRQHTGADLLVIVKCKDEVGKVGMLEHPMRTSGVAGRLTLHPIRKKGRKNPVRLGGWPLAHVGTEKT